MIRALPGALAGLSRYGATPAAIGRMISSRPGPVLIDDHGPMTGAELWTVARRMATHWSSDAPRIRRVGLIGRQDRHFVIGLMSASILGWDVVGLSPRQQDERLRSIAEGLDLTAIAGIDDERVRRVAGRRTPLRLSTGSDRDGAPRRAPRPNRHGRLILLSSGTTGLPSGAARRRYGPSLTRPARALWRTIEPTGGPMMILAPLWHGYGLGMLLLGMVGGVPILLTDRRSSSDRSSIAVRHQPRTVVVLPTQLDALVGRWPSRPPSLHRVITGSAPLSPQLCRRALDVLGPRLINLYGSTEAGWATWATPEDLARLPGTIGRPAPGVRVTIVDGQLYVDSPFGTDPRRPTPTGDRGHRTDDGLLIIDGRLDDTVIIDGNNVSLSDVQRALDHRTDIVHSVVRAETDPVHGCRLIADVQLTPGTDPAAIRRELARELDWFAVPELHPIHT